MSKPIAATANEETVIFLGPTLPWLDAVNLMPARYLPPAQMGDVYALLGSGIRRIVLIDGLFGGVPSIWQRELLTAIDLGLDVWGCSSMGALRAAELHTLGMHGHGRVFSAFCDGLISNDDEVVLKHESGYPFRALTVPLVNIRDGLDCAVAEAVFSSEISAELLACAAAIPYELRTVEYWFDTASQRLNAATLECFRAFWSARQPDVKADDAKSLLRLLAQLPVSEQDTCLAGYLDPLHQWSSIALMMRHCKPQLEEPDAAPLTAGGIWLKTNAERRSQAIAVASQLWLLDLALAQSDHAPPPQSWLENFAMAWGITVGLQPSDRARWCRSNALTGVELEGEIQRRAHAYWRLLNPSGMAALEVLDRFDEQGFLADTSDTPFPLRWCLFPVAVEGSPVLSLLELVQRSTQQIVALLQAKGLSLGADSGNGTALDWPALQQHWPELPARLGYHDWDAEAQGLRVLQVCGLLGS
jgi:hypothetical protein